MLKFQWTSFWLIINFIRMCFSYCMYMSIQYSITSVVVFRFIMKVIIFTTILLFMDYFWVKHCSMMSGLLVSFNTNHRCVIGYNTHQKPHQTLYIYILVQQVQYFPVWHTFCKLFYNYRMKFCLVLILLILKQAQKVSG